MGSGNRLEIRRLRKFLLYFWIIVIISFWVWFYFSGFELSQRQIVIFLSKFQDYIILGYLLFAFIRAFTLIPNAWVVLAGAVLIKNFWILLLSSLFMYIVSSLIIYFFGGELGLEEFFKKKYGDKGQQIEQKINTYGGLVILVWSFIPFFPSDLLSFVLGSLEYPVKKFVIYSLIGHIVIYTGLILLGKEFWLILFKI